MKKQTLDSKTQSRIDHTEEARNSKSGFKNTMSAGTRGVGDTLLKK